MTHLPTLSNGLDLFRLYKNNEMDTPTTEFLIKCRIIVIGMMQKNK
jgi:hypothetical protein